MAEKKYFIVTARCGHVGGPKYYIPVDFPVRATTAAEAAERTRWFPRVKHHHVNAIIRVEKTDSETFYNLVAKNETSPYLSAKNPQEQRLYEDELAPLICLEEDYLEGRNAKKRESHSNKNIYRGKEKIRRPNRWKAMCDTYA